MPIGVLLVHGVGDQTSDWADAHIRLLRQRVGQELVALKLDPAPDPVEAFLIGRVHWADVLQGHQQELSTILNMVHDSATSSPDEAWWVRFINWITGKLRKAEGRFIAEFIGDVIGYHAEATRTAIYATVTRALDELSAKLPAGSEKFPLTIISHSLGAVIVSDYIWDQAKARRQQGLEGFHARWRFDNFFTMGSPMALFALQYGGAQAFSQPISLEHPGGRWVNIYDTNDPISMPLRPLNAAYRKTVLADARVRNGFYLWAHDGYFTSSHILGIIGRKLALDWCAEHSRLPAERLSRLAAQYDSTFSRLDNTATVPA